MLAPEISTSRLDGFIQHSSGMARLTRASGPRTTPLGQGPTTPDAELAQLIPQGGRAADRAAWTVEGGQDPAAGGLDQPPAPLLDQPAGQLVVHVQQLAPAPVTYPLGLPGRVHDIGEQHRGQHPGELDTRVGPDQEFLDHLQDQLRLAQTIGRSPGSSTSLALGMCSAR
jgi:hypothetical protein